MIGRAGFLDGSGPAGAGDAHPETVVKRGPATAARAGAEPAEPARTRTVRLQDGRTFVFDEDYGPWRDADGTVVGITGRVTLVLEGEFGEGA